MLHQPEVFLGHSSCVLLGTRARGPPNVWVGWEGDAERDIPMKKSALSFPKRQLYSHLHQEQSEVLPGLVSQLSHSWPGP